MVELSPELSSFDLGLSRAAAVTERVEGRTWGFACGGRGTSRKVGLSFHLACQELLFCAFAAVLVDNSLQCRS
jgi:hypothetical protein